MATDRLAMVLTLAGSRTRIYGGQGVYTPAQPATYPAAYPCNAFNGLDVLGFASLKQELPHVGGVGKAATITLKVYDRAGAAAALFGPTETGVPTAILATTLPAETGTATIAADGDISGFPAAGYLYIGQEAIHYTSKNDGTGVFTLHANGRGALDSLVREHLRDNVPARSFKPVISAHPLHWAHRKAVLTMHRVFEDGTIETEPQFELLRGSLRLNPTPDDADNSFTLQLVDELAKFDRVIGTGLERTTLVDNYYYSDGARACHAQHFELLPEGCITGGMYVFSHKVNAAKAAGAGGAGALVLYTNRMHNACFGTARGNNPGDPSNGPVKLRNRMTGQVDALESSPSGYTGLTQIDLSEDNTGAVTAGDVANSSAIVTNIAQHRFCNTDPVFADPPYLPAGLHRWPSAFIKEFNERVNTTGGTPGMYYVEASLSNDGTRLRVVDSGFAFDSNNPPQFGPRLQVPFPNNVWYPIFRLPEGDPIDDGIDQLSLARASGYYLDPPVRPDRDMWPIMSSADEPAYYTYLEPATAFWQGGRYLLINDNVLPDASPAHPQYLRALRNGTHKWTGAPLESILQYDEVVAQNNADGAFIGYRVRLTDWTLEQFDRRNRWVDEQGDGRFGPFGNWNLPEGRTEAQITAYAELAGDPRIILLRLMLSGFGGVAFPDSTYSVLPRAYGLSMDPAAVDIEGIRNFPMPRGRMQSLGAFRQEKPVSAKSLLDGILKGLQAGLVMANVGGVQKITLVEVRSAHIGRSVGTIADRDWIGKARPGSGRLDNKTSSWQFETNWDSGKQKFLRTPQFHDADVIDAKGGAQSAALKLSIRGLHVQYDRELLNLYQQLRHKYGRDKRLFTGEVSWTTAKNFGVGQVVTVTAARGLDNAGGRGIFAVPMQITSASWNPVTRRCALGLLFDATQFGGYAPVVTVDTVTDANTVGLSGNTWSFPAYDDWQWFLQNKDTLPGGGIPCECVHVGQEENNTANTITGVDQSFGRFTIVGHGLAVGDRVRVASWDLTLAYLQVFVHLLEDGDAGLGAGNNPPFRYG